MDQSFLDPLQFKDGTPYAPVRTQEIIKECWYISDQLHTSYVDVLDMSYVERMCLLNCINEKREATERELARLDAQRKASKHK